MFYRQITVVLLMLPIAWSVQAVLPGEGPRLGQNRISLVFFQILQRLATVRCVRNPDVVLLAKQTTSKDAVGHDIVNNKNGVHPESRPAIKNFRGSWKMTSRLTHS